MPCSRETDAPGDDCEQGECGLSNSLMPPVTENYSLGLPVEIDRIGTELKKLWQEGEGVMSRASLMNLAVYSEDPNSLAENTRIISEVTRSHACRAIVIEANPKATENRVQAWISAHCHVGQAGSKQICSEQLSFSLQGPCAELLPNIVFSHLDSDLPFYFWWQGALRDPMDPQLWAWVDRFIYDSRDWDDFAAQMRLVESAQEEARQRIVLCDLNWTRLDKMRVAIAQLFDHPASHHHFAKIKAGQIYFAPGFRSTALLLVGWLAAQLNWQLEKVNDANRLQFANPAGGKVEIDLRERDEHAVGEVSLSTGEVEFLVRHARCGDLLEVSRGKPDDTRLAQLVPAQSNDPVELMTQELFRGGQHRVYLRAANYCRQRP
jgi:glucose-6-phosphate dehydrogenase assembly protein OpcA